MSSARGPSGGRGAGKAPSREIAKDSDRQERQKWPERALTPSRGGTLILPHARTPRTGVETELVDAFIAKLPYEPDRESALTIFREPRLDSGFPDLVVVRWNREAAAAWAQPRPKLTRSDFRLLQLLVEYGPASTSTIIDLFGTKARRDLDRLRADGVLRLRQDRWHHSPLRQLFAVREIIAIEAKIKDWSDVISQAMINTWFASHSFALVPRVPRMDLAVTRARELGVGIWTLGSQASAPKRVAAARRRALPRSYASWLFNEWVWQDVSRHALG